MLGMMMRSKRNLAVHGCKTTKDMELVVYTLEESAYGGLYHPCSAKDSVFPKNVVFDNGEKEGYYCNWILKVDREAYNNCEKITFDEFKEMFAKDIAGLIITKCIVEDYLLTVKSYCVHEFKAFVATHSDNKSFNPLYAYAVFNDMWHTEFA